MAQIDQVLAQKGIGYEELPAHLKSQYDQLVEISEQHDDIVDWMDDPENEGADEKVVRDKAKELKNLAAACDELEEKLIAGVKAHDFSAAPAGTAGNSKPNSGNIQEEEPKEGGSGMGILLGAVLLVVSLGAVNYFKNR